MKQEALKGWGSAALWAVRILVGVTFIMAGYAKVIDPWGTIFKIEEYLNVWDIDVPRTIVFVSSLGLAIFESLTGLFVATGCCRRFAVWCVLACMAFMLPLTLYLWIYNPVPDCGCFGDMITLSNAATFFKNIVITALAIGLMKYNTRVKPLYIPEIQWIVTFVAGIYLIAVGLIGFNIQPLIDFRSYPAGTPVADVGAESSAPTFIYEKDGERRAFSAYELPDDSWTYVDRQDNSADDDHTITLFDPYTDDDVTDEVFFDTTAGLMLLTIPETSRADLSYTYIINELNEALLNEGGTLAAVIATDADGIDRWRDRSMADYPCYIADDTEIKELARGRLGLVYIKNDTIRWKRTVSSLTLNDVEQLRAGTTIDFLAPDYRYLLHILTYPTLAILVIIYIFQVSISAAINRIKNKKNGSQEETTTHN